MISKLAVWGADREQAIDRMRRALGEFVISGELRTNLDFHRWIITHPKFLKGEFDTHFIDHEYHPNSSARSNGAAPDSAELAAIFLAAITAQNNTNHSNSVAAQAPAVSQASPWRMLGRLDMLRR
jgi:acetyl/propionyl-CoA carboxylase alpha subunit